jgi:hypothetical protein
MTTAPYIYGNVPLYTLEEAVALAAVVDAIKDGNQLKQSDNDFLHSLVAGIKFGPQDDLRDDDEAPADKPEFVGRGVGVLPGLRGKGRGESGR